MHMQSHRYARVDADHLQLWAGAWMWDTPWGWKMMITQIWYSADGEAWYFWKEWMNSTETRYSKPLLIKTSAASNTRVFTLLRTMVLAAKNYKATLAFHSLISRNKCLFILWSLWLYNYFSVVVSSVLAAVWCGEEVELVRFHQRGLSEAPPWTLCMWVRNKSAPDLVDSSFCFHWDRGMGGHQMQRAKCGAPAKSFESQRRASLCQEVEHSCSRTRRFSAQLRLCRGVSAVYRDHIKTGMSTMSNYCLCSTT